MMSKMKQMPAKSFSADITYRTSEGGRLTASVDGKQAENSDPSNNT